MKNSKTNFTTSLNLNPTHNILSCVCHIPVVAKRSWLIILSRGQQKVWLRKQEWSSCRPVPLDLTAGYMRGRAIEAESHIERERAPSEKLPSICQLSSCGNIFKWTLFILFDSLSERGTMRRELGQWRHSGPLLRVR